MGSAMKVGAPAWIAIIVFSLLGIATGSTDDAPNVLHIGGIFPIEGEGGWQGGQACKPAASLALDDVNKRKDLLPGFILQLHWNDSECEPGLGASVMYDLLYNQPQKLMLLAGCSTVCTTVAEAAKMWNLVVMCYGASSPALSDRNRFPTMFRTHPSATVHNPTRIKLMEKFGWSRVAILQQAEEVFTSTVEDLEARCKETNIEIVTRQSFLTDPTDAVRNLRRQDARIIIGLFYVVAARRVLCEMYKQQLYGKSYVWFFIGWYEDNWFEVNLQKEGIECTAEEMRKAAEGHLTTEALMWNQNNQTTISGKTSEDFRKELNEVLRQSGYDIDNKRYPEGYQEAPLAYDAVWSVALAFNKTMAVLKKKGKSLKDFTYTNKDIADEIYSAINSTQFVGVSGVVAFSSQGDRIALTQIEQMINGSYVKLGYYNTEADNLTWFNREKWNGNKIPQDRTVVRRVLRTLSFPLFICMWTISSIGILVAIALIFFNTWYRHRRVIQHSHPICNTIMLSGCIISLFSVFLLGLDGQFIPARVYPQICQARVWLLSFGFTLGYGAMFSKVWRVHRFTTKAKTDPKKKVEPWKLYTMVSGLLVIDFIILLVWQVYDPLQRRIEIFPLEDPPNTFDDVKIRPELEHCESEHNNIWMGIMYGYKGLVLLFGLFLAYETRSIKVKQINDSRYVGMSIYNVVVFCLITAPVCMVIASQQDASFAFVSLSIIFCCFLSMALIFTPKVIEVIRHPRDKAESKYNPDVKLTKEDEEKYEKLLAENDELVKLIRAALSCLVQLASVRRSLFTNTERTKFLTHLVNGVKHILQNPQGLSDPSNYHEFCRLLARLKSNYQLGELVTVDNYPEAIQLIAKFTVESLQMWQFAPNSVHYLLSLWQRMVASVPYVKAQEPHLLEIYTPEVTKAYITSRLESVAVVIREGLEDPFNDLGMVQQQLEQLSVIGRCEYQKTCTLLVQLFDQAARAYQEALSMPTPNSIEISIQEGRLTWLVYIIGSAIAGRVSFSSNEELDAMDGELVCRVLQLMTLTDSRLTQGGCEKLEQAMLSFFEHFRKIYVGDQIQKNSKVYRRLSEVLGLSDESMVLSVFIRKIITNLKYWGRSEQIISKTLQLLNDLSVGFSCVRKLVKLDEVQFMLNNHTSEHFPFLGNNIAFSEMRCRSMFYTSLGRLLMVDLGEDEERFQNFMLPLTATFESVGSMLASADTPLFDDFETQTSLIGLARDIRGLAFAFNTKVSYMMLFDWVYPSYTAILLHAMELWYHIPRVTTPVLKLFAELVQNRSQRLQFDVSSPNGILLFREASKVICSYGSHILNVEVSKDQIYPQKLKGISVCFSMLRAALCGNYVNFGVFRIYGDEALDNVLNTFVKLLLSINLNDLLDYPKLSQTYYVLLECLAQDHMSFLSTLEPTAFLYILSSISEGLTALDTMICTGCCATLDHIVTYLFKQLTAKGKKTQRGLPAPNDMFLQVLEGHPEILQQILSTVLNVIMFEDCKNQWSMSRPLLGLILLNEEYFNGLKEQIIRNQPVDKQATMLQWFDNLMNGIERNLQTKNRDKFTQNLSMFRRGINDSLKGPNVPPVCEMVTS